MSERSSLLKGRTLFLLLVLMMWVMACNADGDEDHHDEGDHEHEEGEHHEHEEGDHEDHEEGDHHEHEEGDHEDHEEGDHHDHDHDHDHDHEHEHGTHPIDIFFGDFDADHNNNLDLSEVYKTIDGLKIDGTCVMEEYTHRGFSNGIADESDNLHTLLLLLGAQLATQTCTFGDLHTEGKEEDLLDRLMLNFGDGVSVRGEDLFKMWTSMVLNQKAKAQEEGGGDHHGHNHARSQQVLSNGAGQVLSRRVSVQEDDHAHAYTCTYLTNNLSISQLYQSAQVRDIVEGYVVDIIEGCHNVGEECNAPSSAEVWGYSTFAVLIVTLLAVVTIVIAVPVMRMHHLLFEGTLAFAAGTLLGDAFLHILPALLGGHSHGISELDDYGKRNHMLVVLATIWLFYTIDWFCRGALEGKQAEDIVSVCPGDMSVKSATRNGKEPDEDDEGMEKQIDKMEKEKEEEQEKEERSPWAWTPMREVSRIVWVVVVADGVHNITDGLSIGAAFSTSQSLGISTSIASGFHEIPQEVADFAVLLAAGLSPFQAVVLNLLSGCSSIIANFVACAVGTSSKSSTSWFLAITVGSFVYLATGIVVPEILHAVNKIRFKQLAVHTFGMVLGALLMWIVAITENHDDC